MPSFGRSFRSSNSKRRSGGGLDNGTSTSSDDTSTLNMPLPSNNANLSQTEYARRCRELLELNKDLEALGAGAYFSLPRVAVIGSQSAGKSSLVEAVSEINVPRDSGTCTRCPMYCEMTSGDTWSCTISLKKYNADGATPTTTPFGQTITDKSSVELWLRRAQAAVLSPHRSPEDFYKKTMDEIRALVKSDKEMKAFSNSVVQIRLKGPGLTDLSFIDLPGLIQNASQDMIELVKSLSLSYIDGEGSENTLILVTLPMSEDIQNQAAALLARKCDPKGNRTIGVVTKPDLVTAGSTGLRQQWLATIENADSTAEHYLKHGYYCVRLPDDDERARNLSREESQRLAEDYFNTPPWSRFPDRRRFGITNLVSDVSRLLVELIESNLPKLKLQVKELLDKTIQELSTLPPPPSSQPAAEVSRMVTSFCNDIRRTIMAESNQGVVRENRSIYSQFKREIWKTGINFTTMAYEGTYRGADSDGFSDRVIPSQERSETPCGEEFLDLNDVREVIVNSVGWELPGHVPFEATKQLVLRSTSKWREPTIECFHAVYENLEDTVREFGEERFSQYPLLHQFIDSLVQDRLTSCKENALLTLEKIIKIEGVPLYTQNYHEFDTEKRKWRSHYLAELRGWRPVVYDNSIRAISTKSVEPEYPEPEYLDEANVMAGVRAYFKVAFKRYIDIIPLLIEHELNQAFAFDLAETLFGHLLEGSDSSTRLRDLVSEDPEIAKQRKALETKIHKLKTIQEKLAAH